MGVARSDLVQGKNGLSGPIVKGNTDGAAITAGEIGEVLVDYSGTGFPFNTTVLSALSLTIPAGVWMLTCSCSHSRNASTYSRLWLRNVTDGVDIRGSATSSNQGNKYSEYSCVVYFKNESTKTVDLRVQSSAGSGGNLLEELSTGGFGAPQGGRFLQAIRIA